MSGDPVALELERLPAVAAVFGRGLALALVRRQGRASAALLASLPPMSARVGGVTTDPARLARYRDVCGVEDRSNVLPPAYPEALFLGLMGSLVTHRVFPLSPLGLIHVRQTIEQRAPITARERLDLTCRLAGTRATERGVEVDWSMEVDVGGERRWDGVATVLSRRRAGHGQAGKPSATSGTGETPLDELAELEVTEPTGRRFARASGDLNPHHLWSFTARPLGYRRPIAHGMWTLARLLAELERGAAPHPLVRADVAFKQPIPLPSRVRLLASRAVVAGGERRVEVRPASGDGLHLVGRVALGR